MVNSPNLGLSSSPATLTQVAELGRMRQSERLAALGWSYDAESGLQRLQSRPLEQSASRLSDRLGRVEALYAVLELALLKRLDRMRKEDESAFEALPTSDANLP